MHSFTVAGHQETSFLTWFMNNIREKFTEKGYRYLQEPEDNIRIVFNLLDRQKPRPFRRKAQATFVVSIIEEHEKPEDIFKAAYPYLIRSLANHLIYVLHHDDHVEFYFITPEQGFYKIRYDGDDESFFQKVFERLEPVASSELVINNEFYDDLDQSLWNGNIHTEKIYHSGRKLNEMNLLPAPFPLEEYLTPRDMRQLKRLYGIGGLSYGNLSSRDDNESHFWMSASGVDKGNMRNVGQDILYITGFNRDKNAMEIRVPPEITPKRASVDAIEHWMIYKEYPDVGAIVHIHAWMDGVQATEINYPCGTIQLAKAVVDLVRSSEDPSRAVIGLKNHGLTITGRDLDDIFERIDGKVVNQVPMT